MHEYAITVIGPDRPGIIADITEAVAGAGLNLTDSTMTLLRGHFAMTLVCVGDLAPGDVEAGLAPLHRDLVVAVREISTGDGGGAGGGHFVLRLHGADRLGIVAAVTRVVADAGGNITDLTTRLSSGLYVVIAEVDLPATAQLDELAGRLHRVGAGLGVEVTFTPAESDLL